MVTDLSVKGKHILTSIMSSLHAYGVLSKESFFKIPDMKISSQLLYGAEVWGLKRYECLERIQDYACKRYMNVGQNRCNAAVLGDCNRFPMYNRGVTQPFLGMFSLLLKDLNFLLLFQCI